MSINDVTRNHISVAFPHPLARDEVIDAVNSVIRSGAVINFDAAAGAYASLITDVNDNELLDTKGVASAVNQLGIANAATGTSPIIEARGGDTNISIQLLPKGSGVVQAANPFVEEMTQTALTDTATVTAAQLLTKVLDGTPTAAATYTLSTAALLVAAIPGARVGDSFWVVINNKSGGANTITVAAGTGGTADGTLTVAQNVIRSFLVIITNVTASSEAYFVYGIG